MEMVRKMEMARETENAREMEIGWAMYCRDGETEIAERMEIKKSTE
jgi:hypothetical protein